MQSEVERGGTDDIVNYFERPNMGRDSLDLWSLGVTDNPTYPDLSLLCDMYNGYVYY